MTIRDKFFEKSFSISKCNKFVDTILNSFIFILGFSFGMYSFFLSFHNSSIFYLFGFLVGLLLAFFVADRNVYYKRYNSFVDIVIENNLPISRKTYTTMEYNASAIVNKSESYEEVGFDNEEYSSDCDVEVVRDYISQDL